MKYLSLPLGLIRFLPLLALIYFDLAEWERAVTSPLPSKNRT